MPGPVKNNLYQNAQLKPVEQTPADVKNSKQVGTVKGHEVKLEDESQGRIRKRHKAYLKTQKKQAKKEDFKEKAAVAFFKKDHQISKVHEPRLGEGNFGMVDQRIKAESKADFFRQQGLDAKVYGDLQGDIGRFVVEKTAKDLPGRNNDLKRDVTIYQHFTPHPNIMGLASSPSNLKQAAFDHGGVDLRGLMREKEIKAVEEELYKLDKKLSKASRPEKRAAINVDIKKLEAQLYQLNKEAWLKPSMVMSVVLQSARGLAHLHGSSVKSVGHFRLR